jgi:DMSO/TMAO reductase YedYZ molybdopterin-dependent catalytic subunit
MIDMHRPSRVAGAIAGLLAGGAALGVAELLAGLVDGIPSPVNAIGSLVIALQPPGAKQLVADLFGTNDKLVLTLAVLVVALILSAGLGILARSGRADEGPSTTRFRMAIGGFVLVGLLAIVAALTNPPVNPALAIGSVVIAVGVAWQVLALLLRRAAVGAARGPVAEMPDWSRRRFIGTSLMVGAGALAGGTLGRLLINYRNAAAVPIAELPAPAATVAPVPSTAEIDVSGISPLVTPNDDFYRIDTKLITPHVDASTWKLTVTGMVNNEVSLTYDQLVAMPLYEQYVTIQCVSNDVGGNLVGNALWQGVRLRDVLDQAGVQEGATQIVGRAFDGWTCGFPTAWLTESDREALIAVAMNGQPLPAAHGFPARLIVPGLYGYVSATKWLTNIELTTLEAFDAYWVPLGWSKLGPIKTASRIDTPRAGSSPAAGVVPVAGVAWAPDRGISKVEVEVDDGTWQPAELATAISDATWVQWVYRWQATAGQHTLRVRATDGDGNVQIATPHDPAPNGATGYHEISVQVS